MAEEGSSPLDLLAPLDNLCPGRRSENIQSEVIAAVVRAIHQIEVVPVLVVNRNPAFGGIPVVHVIVFLGSLEIVRIIDVRIIVKSIPIRGLSWSGSFRSVAGALISGQCDRCQHRQSKNDHPFRHVNRLLAIHWKVSGARVCEGGGTPSSAVLPANSRDRKTNHMRFFYLHRTSEAPHNRKVPCKQYNRHESSLPEVTDASGSVPRRKKVRLVGMAEVVYFLRDVSAVQQEAECIVLV